MNDPNNKPKKPIDQIIRDEAFKADALNHIKYKPKYSATDTERLLQKAMALTLSVRKEIKPVLDSVGGKDLPALRALIMTFYLEAFNSRLFDREELASLCAILHCEIMVEELDRDPHLSGTDLMG